MKKFSSIDVFLEKRKTRLYVGRLTFLKNEKVFEFTYDEKYLYAKNIIPLGPEFPLTKKSFRSAKLFLSLQDRIPSKENPAYPDYCKSMGIFPDETNPIVLLGTIGKRGPSSFVFEPHFNEMFSKEDFRKFRKKLRLSTRDFAQCFDFSRSTLALIESGKVAGKEILKRIEIYYNFPETALFEIERHGGSIHPTKKKHLIQVFKSMMKS